jgi:hypothetical protein
MTAARALYRTPLRTAPLADRAITRARAAARGLNVPG